MREDARRHNALQFLQAQADKVRREEQLRRSANATVRPAGESDEEEDDEDDLEFRRYKMERLKQMQQHASASAQLPTFGSVEQVAALDMPAAVDGAGSSQTYVVVHLQEDYLASCVRLSFKLGEVAARYDQVRFLDVPASEAKPDLDPAELPILVVYLDGQFMASASRVGRGGGEELTSAAVEEQLLKIGVRLTSSATMKAADAAALRRLRELDLGAGPRAEGGGREESDGSDDDDEEEEEEEERRRGARRIIGMNRPVIDLL